jgi:hypothetical protein
MEEFQRASPKRWEALSNCDEPLLEPEQRVRIALTRLDVDDLVVAVRIYDDRQVELLRVGL